MTPATREQIGSLGHEEKQAAQGYVVATAKDLQVFPPGGVVRWAFLQGIHWERQRAAREASTASKDVGTFTATMTGVSE